MAAPDPLLDEELTDEDRRTVNDVEAPVQQSGEGPAPLDLEEEQPPPPTAPPLDLTPPDVGAEGPTMQTPIAGVPGAMAATPTAPPLPGTAPVPPGMQPVTPPKPGSAEDIAQRQGVADVERAKINAGVTDQQAAAAKLADEDARLERADYLQRRQDAEKDLAERMKRYDSLKFEDPRQKTKGWKSTLAVIFGGLGAAYRSAGGGDSHNTALTALQKRWDDDAEIQRANIAAAKDSVIQARTRIDNIDEGRRLMTRDADAQLLSKYNLALKQGEAQLKNQGIAQAGIDADARIVQLRLGQAAAAARVQKDEDAHALNQARITRLNAQAARDNAKAGKRGAGGGGGGSGGALSKFVEQAGQLAPGDPIPASLVVLGRQAGLKVNQIAGEVDKYRGSGNKAGAAAAKANGAGAGGIGSVRQNAVLGNLAEAEKAAKDITPGAVSQDSIQQLQVNEERSKAAKHSAESGVAGALGTAIGRSTGLVPRGRYDGIPEDQQKRITAAEQVITHLTEMQQGKNIETLEQYRERYSPYVPGLSMEEVHRREAALPGLVAEQRAIQDPNRVGVKRVAAAEGGGLDAERMRKARAALASPDAPDAVKKEAAKFIKQAIKAAGTRAPSNNGGEPIEDLVP